MLTHTLQHGHYLRIHPGMNIELFTQESSSKVTCCLLSKGIFLLDILRCEVQATRPSKNERFENVIDLYEYAD